MANTLSRNHPVLLVVSITQSANQFDNCTNNYGGTWIYINQDMTSAKHFFVEALEQLSSCDEELFSKLQNDQAYVFVIHANGDIYSLNVKASIELSY